MAGRMISVYHLKPRFQALLRPLAFSLAAIGVTANQVTIAAAAGSLAVGGLVASSGNRTAFLLIAVWLLIRMALNALDGMLAREFGQKSPLGAYLNELGDVVSDAALYAPFALIAPFEPLGVGGVIVLAVISEFAGALGPMVGASRHYEGPMGKSDRAVVFGALAVWIGGGGALPDWLGLLIPMLAGLLVLTAINRVRGGLAELSEAAAPSIAQPAVVLPLRPVEEGLFQTHDNTRLFYRFWPAISGPPKGRGRAVPSRARAWGPDRAPGRRAGPARIRLLSPGTPAATAVRRASAGTARASAPRCATCRASSTHIASAHGIAPQDIAVVGQSVGAVLVATWAHDYAPDIRCVVLASPAFKVKLYVPFARFLLKLRYAVQGLFFVNSYVKAKFLTHDPERVRSYNADPLITRPIAANILLQLYETAERVVADARAIIVPTQLLISGADWVVHARAAAPVLRAARCADQGTSCASRVLSRHLWREGPGGRGA